MGRYSALVYGLMRILSNSLLKISCLWFYYVP